jgi:translation initiation factor 3 subunit C
MLQFAIQLIFYFLCYLCNQQVKKVHKESDDESWPSQSEESEGESSEDEGRQELKGREKWLKRDVAVVAKKKVVKKKAEKEPRVTKEKGPKQFESTGDSKNNAQWRIEENLTEEALEKKLTDLIASRGKKRSDMKAVLRQLEVLSKIARFFGPRKEILALMHRISAMFDSHRIIDDFMDLQTWRNCHSCMTRILTILDSNPKIVLGLINPEDTALIASNVQKAEISSSSGSGDVLRLVGSIESFLIRLQDEYTKGLQQINPHTQVHIGS